MRAQVHGSSPHKSQLQSSPLPWARLIADTLTLSRLLGGVLLAVMPWEKSVVSLGRLVKYSVLLWSTDAVDGRLARRSQTASSRIGKHDIWVDAALVVGIAVALSRAGYLPPWSLVGWALTCTLLYAVRPVDTVLLVFMLPLHCALPVLAIIHGCPEAWLYAVWLAALALLCRKRLKWVIETFVEGLPERQRQWVCSWLPSWLRLTSEERAAFQASQSPPAPSARHMDAPS